MFASSRDLDMDTIGGGRKHPETRYNGNTSEFLRKSPGRKCPALRRLAPGHTQTPDSRRIVVPPRGPEAGPLPEWVPDYRVEGSCERQAAPPSRGDRAELSVGRKRDPGAAFAAGRARLASCHRSCGPSPLLLSSGRTPRTSFPLAAPVTAALPQQLGHTVRFPLSWPQLSALCPGPQWPCWGDSQRLQAFPRSSLPELPGRHSRSLRAGHSSHRCDPAVGRGPVGSRNSLVPSV